MKLFAIVNQSDERHEACIFDSVTNVDSVTNILEYVPNEENERLIAEAIKSLKKFPDSGNEDVFEEIINGLKELPDSGNEGPQANIFDEIIADLKKLPDRRNKRLLEDVINNLKKYPDNRNKRFLVDAIKSLKELPDSGNRKLLADAIKSLKRPDSGNKRLLADAIKSYNKLPDSRGIRPKANVFNEMIKGLKELPNRWNDRLSDRLNERCQAAVLSFCTHHSEARRNDQWNEWCQASRQNFHMHYFETKSLIPFYRKAIEEYNQSLETYEKLGNKIVICIFVLALHHLGDEYRQKGDYEEAIKIYDQSLKMCEKLEDKNIYASVLWDFGSTYHQKGNYEEAVKLYNLFLGIDGKTKYEVSNLEMKSNLEIYFGSGIHIRQIKYVVDSMIDKKSSSVPMIYKRYYPVPLVDEKSNFCMGNMLAWTTKTVSSDKSVIATGTTEHAKTFVRYPHIECPDKLNLGIEFSLIVHLLVKSTNPNIKCIDIEDQDLHDKLPEVEIVIFARDFDIKGTNTKYIKVDRDKDSDERFVLTPKELGEQEIRVDFYQCERRIGTERRIVMVTEGSAINEVNKSGYSRVLRLKPRSKRCPPDLEICVQQDRKDKQNLLFFLYTPQALNVDDQTGEKIGYNHNYSGQVHLERSPEEMTQELFHEMSKMARSTDTESNMEQRMAAIGNSLWKELIPEKLKDRYWKFGDHVKSLLITSDEPWIPWEIIKPFRNNNGKREDDLFWCQKFEFSRWLSGPATEYELSTGKAQPVAPANINLTDFIEEEIRFIEQLSNLHPGIKGMPHFKNRKEVLDFMENEVFTLLHFATHGKFDTTLPNNSLIELDGGCLRPSDVNIFFSPGRPRPLIFINSCEGAQMGFSFTELGGWADCLVNNAEVGAFASAMWEVEDSLALEFIKNFYTAFLKDNQTIAQAFRTAREVVRKAKPYNSTWLAYVLYADPEAVCSRDAAIPF